MKLGSPLLETRQLDDITTAKIGEIREKKGLGNQYTTWKQMDNRQ